MPMAGIEYIYTWYAGGKVELFRCFSRKY